MYRYKDHVSIPIIHRRGFGKSYKEIDRSLPVLSKLHLDVMISIDTIIFKQGVQHLNLVWFLPSKCKVLSREMESCYITGIFNFRYVYVAGYGYGSPGISTTDVVIGLFYICK